MKYIKRAAVIFLIFILIGLTSLFFDRYLIPKISTNKFFAQFKILQGAGEGTTIIEKTEQIIVREDDSVNRVASQAATTLVNIISLSEAGQSKSGSGIVATGDGLIVTYRDAIIEKKAKYKIMAFNDQGYDGELLGVDEFSNLAFLKISAENLPVIAFADSGDFQAGKKIIAIGNSFGEFQNRFAAGILSNTNRTFNIAGKAVASSEKLEGVFEADFAQQDQYVGGPIINYNGELAGIIGVAQIDNQKEYFAVPANVVKNAMDLAIKKEIATRPYLGLYYVSITKAYAFAHNLSRDRGALVHAPSGKQGLAVIFGSPAEKAGIRINDIVIAVNGQEINLDRPLSNSISGFKKGEFVDVLLVRDGKEIQVKVGL